MNVLVFHVNINIVLCQTDGGVSSSVDIVSDRSILWLFYM